MTSAEGSNDTARRAAATGGALERLRDALEAVGCYVRERGGAHVDAQCPAHEDRVASLSADWRDGRMLLTCHAGCDTRDVLTAVGLSWADLWDEGAAGGRPTSTQAARPAGRKRATSKAAGKETSKATQVGDPRRWPVVARYRYEHADGRPAGERLRKEPREDQAPAGGGRVKTFAWRRVDDRGRMVWGKPAELPLYRLPAVLATAAAGGTVYVTEGEKDADAITAAGATATTLGAVDEPWRQWHTDALAGAHVRITADRDQPGYRRAAELAGHLEGTAASVTVLEARAGKDPADHLAAGHGLGQLAPVSADVLAAHAPATRPAPAGDSDPAAAPDNVRVLPGRGNTGNGNGGGGAPPIDPADVDRDDYHRVGDALVKRKAGGTRAKQVLDCAAWMTRRVRRDLGDGEHPPVTHVDLIAERDGQRVELPGIEWDDFVSCAWLADLPWPVVYTRTHQGRSDVVNAVVATSGPVPVDTAYGALGWRELPGGGWHYVHAGGAIGASGQIEGVSVDVPASLDGYRLPAPPDGHDQLRAAVWSSLQAMTELPAAVAAPLLGAAYRALLGPSRTTVTLIGATGGGKTSLASLALQHYAPGARHDQMPHGAGEDANTTVALERLRYLAGHSVFVADDLAPDRSAERSAQRANQLARSQHNATGKGRGDREGDVRPARPPRGLLVLTGEDGAGTASAENRMVYVPVEPGTVSRRALARLGAREHATGRGQLTASLARWWAPHMDTAADWLDTARAQAADALIDPDCDDPGPESRRADMLADLAAGWRAMLAMATATGALSDEEADNLWCCAWTGLVECQRQQAAVTARRTLAQRAADTLRSAITRGQAHLEARGGGAPPDADVWGWDTGSTLAGDRALGDRVGWTDGDTLWLDPGAAYATMERQARAETDPLAVTARAVSGALANAGWLTVQQRAHQAHRSVERTLAGVERSVWELPAGWLFPHENAPEPAPIPDPPNLHTDPAAAGILDGAGRPVDALSPGASGGQRTTAPDQEHRAGLAHGAGTASAGGEHQPTRERPRGPRSVPAVVADVDTAYLSTGDVLEPPAPATLADVADWGASLPLGIEHQHVRPDHGQVWIMPALARRLELPERQPSGEAATEHPALEPLHAAGWQVSRGGLSRWMTVWREGSGTALRIAVAKWLPESEHPVLEGDPPAAALARRLGALADQLGMTYRVSPAVTGIDLIRYTRPPGRRTSVNEAHEPCPPATDRTAESYPLWHRRPTRDERDTAGVVGYDLNGQYLAAASSTQLGTGPARHLDGPVPFDPKTPGYWYVDLGDWPHPYLPNLGDPQSRGRTGPRWYPGPILAVAAELGCDVRPREAWIYEQHSRYLEPWYKTLRDARAALLEPSATDPDAHAVQQTIKRIYAAGIGRLDATAAAGDVLYRPDWRHLVMATARANLTRKLAKVAEHTGRYPLVVSHDAIVYAADSLDPAAACPALLTLGTGLGQVKPLGAAPMADAAPLLDADDMDAVERLSTLIKGEA